MKLEQLDKLTTSISQREAAAQPRIPEARGAGAIGFQQPMNIETASGRLTGSVPYLVYAPEELPRQIQDANTLLRSLKRRIRFHLNGADDKPTVQVQDAETGEVIRQLSPERFLELVAQVQEVAGLFLDQDA